MKFYDVNEFFHFEVPCKSSIVNKIPFLLSYRLSLFRTYIIFIGYISTISQRYLLIVNNMLIYLYSSFSVLHVFALPRIKYRTLVSFCIILASLNNLRSWRFTWKTKRSSGASGTQRKTRDIAEFNFLKNWILLSKSTRDFCNIISPFLFRNLNFSRRGGHRTLIVFSPVK